MRLLALDAATEHCSVALYCDGEIVERGAESGKAHSQQLLGMVAEVLAERSLTLAQLDGIAASIGPGAFTGVRISVAVAQGLAFGASLRVAAVSTLEALALQAYERAQPRGQSEAANAANAAIAATPLVMACLDARMHEVYWGCFSADARLGVRAATVAGVAAPESVILPATPCLGVGRGFATYPVLSGLPGLELPPWAATAAPRARDFARLGALRFALDLTLDPADLQPLYLRDKVALTEAERGARQSVI